MLENRAQHNEQLRLTLTGWGRLGEALAEHEGKPVFVFGGIPGEEVLAEVIKRRRNYMAAQVVKVVSPSPHRVQPPCPYFGACTGCQWQHMDYTFQLEVKRHTVQDTFARVAGMTEVSVPPVLPSPYAFGYRNHARFTVRKSGELGFVHRESRRFVRIDRCLIMHEGVNRILEKLQGKCGETTQLSVRHGVNTGDYLIQPQLGTGQIQLQTGQKHYHEALNGKRLRVSSPSFFQVNTSQAEQMVAVLKEGLCLQGNEFLVDTYAGIGTFAALLAPSVRRVLAIEVSVAAVEDARENLKDLSNVEFVQATAEEALSKLRDTPNVVVLDPPRTGCSTRVLEEIVRLAPKRVAYVSCDPATLARDLRVLCQEPFKLDYVQPIDMFPQTHHIESVAFLTYQPHQGPLVLASASPRRRELLGWLVDSYNLQIPTAPEALDVHMPHHELAQRLALSKALSVAATLESGLVLGADTLVVIDGTPLGKPAHAAEAVEMLTRLRGRNHQVITGVAVLDAATGIARLEYNVSRVSMRNYTDKEIGAYISTGDPLDKAGAYAVQHSSFRPAESVEGCYTNVIGLPLCTVDRLLRWSGFSLKATWPLGGDPQVCALCHRARVASWTS